jgi:phytoene dehydrogenase-like protein
MTDAYDAIVIGAGHNGLTAAAWLARNGRKVLVVESREAVGGLACSREFCKGFRGVGPLHDTAAVRPWIAGELQLAQHGLSPRRSPADRLALSGDTSLWLRGDVETAAAEIARQSDVDGKRYRLFEEFFGRVRPVLSDFLDEPPINLLEIESESITDLMRRGLRLRRLGRLEMMELLRLPPMCVADWLDEWFESDLLKAALALPAVAGTFAGPRSPGTNANLLLGRAAAGNGVKGNGPGLIEALEKAARSAGAEIRTRTTVSEILLDADHAVGVRFVDGESVHADAIVASCDPRRTFLQLLPLGSIDARVEDQVRAYRCRGTTAQLQLALTSPLRFDAHPGETVEFASTGRDLDELEKAFDAVKYRTPSPDPVLEIHQPTVANPGLAPEGHAVASVLIHFAPYDPVGGWTDALYETLFESTLSILETHCGGIRRTITGMELLSPVDIEEQYGVTGGQIHHGEPALDQLLIRPIPGCSRYESPVPRLYLCGSGAHPGGGLTCAPGALAARAILGPERR